MIDTTPPTSTRILLLLLLVLLPLLLPLMVIIEPLHIGTTIIAHQMITTIEEMATLRVERR